MKNLTINISQIVKCFLFSAIVVLNTAAALAQTQIGERNGRLEWNGWILDYDTFTKNDGLTLHNVSYGGIDILGRASFPVMSVYYDNNACGPYADRLNGPQATVSWANNAKLVAREFTQEGKQWFELGIREFIGSYDIYQVWYISADGELDGHVFSRGLQCQVNHIHYPMWRLDFDIAGPAGDKIIRETSPGQFSAYTTEFETNATDAYQHGWFVEDEATGLRVRVDFDNGQWNVAGNVVAASEYSNNLIGAMVSRTSEEAWPGSPSPNFPHDNNENINNADVVMWYRGYLPHTPEEGSALWHSTGIRITADMDSDGDGLNNSVDPDDDNDGVPDNEDALPLNPNESVDTDGDGIGNNADTDDDNDGINDSNDIFPLDPAESRDTDGDGTGDNADIDADNDGIPDTTETAGSNFTYTTALYNAPQTGGSSSQSISLAAQGAVIGQTVAISNVTAFGDLNSANETFTLNFNNGELSSGPVSTGLQCSGGQTAVSPPVSADVSVIDIGAGIPGIQVQATTSTAVNNLTGCTGVDYRLTITGSTVGIDSDGDGVPNVRDLDSDNDGQFDVAEAGGVDANFDGIIDEPATNQGSLSNPTNSDGDSLPDYLDIESANTSNNGTDFDLTGTLVQSLDTNNDGVINSNDATGGTDANENGIDDAIEALDLNGPDTDGDGIPDTTDPDDDNDGVLDISDAFPLDATESVDTDGDGQGNNADTDDDNDGTPDASDAFPLDAAESVDTDGDGQGNNADADDDNDGTPDVSDAFPLDATESVDTDGDGIGNNADPDDDNDGVPDLDDLDPLDPNVGGGQTCNLLSNGTFETGVSDWFTNTTLTNSADARTGNGAISFGDGWIGNVVNATAGTVYTFSGFYKSPVGSGWAGFGVDFVDIDGNEVGELVRSLDSTDVYTAFTLEGQVPAGASFIRPWVYTEAGRSLTIDDMDLRKTGCTNGGGNVNQPPFVANPGSQITSVGSVVSLLVSASDPEGLALTFQATGLPTGLAIDSGTGQISGTATSEFSGTVTVTVSDGEEQGSATFLWTVIEPGGNSTCNQLPDGGFETGLGAWSSNASPVVTNEAFSGNNALTFGGGWISITLPALGATNYALNGQYKSNDGTGWAGFGIDYLDANNNEVGEEVRTLEPGDVYAGFSVTSTSPASTASIRLWFYSDTDRVLTLDDVDLRFPDCVSGGTNNRCNRIINSGFEVSDGGWFTNASPQLTADAADGNQAISITAGFISTALSAQAGTSYTASAMIKSSGSTGWAGMGMDFVDSADVKVGDAVLSIDPSANYSLLQVTGLAPANTAGVQLWFYGDSGRIVYVDQVDLRVAGCQ
ncbi:MAG: putative Ig domain-containing protein [Burkholderiaceae bacterium]